MPWGGIFALLVLVTLAGPVAAGPWARDQGDIFLSYSVSADSSRAAISAGTFDARNYHSIYGELGLGRRLTLGLDIGGDSESQLAVGFLRYTLTDPAAPLQMAVDLGYGQRELAGRDGHPVYRVGFSIGRGFGEAATDWVPFFQPRGGWLVLDSFALIDPDRQQMTWQAEGTLGVNFNERFAGLLQLKAEEWPGAEMAMTLSPSLLIRLRGETSVQVGARFGLQGSDEVGLRLGLWRDF